MCMDMTYTHESATGKQANFDVRIDKVNDICCKTVRR